MKKPFLGAFTTTLDDKHRFVLPSRLCKSLEQETEELFLVLAKSEEGEPYIKILDYPIFESTVDPLKIDSLQLLKKYKYSRIKLPKTHRIPLKQHELDWLFGKGVSEKKISCVGVGNHIVVTAKTIDELLENLEE